MPFVRVSTVRGMLDHGKKQELKQRLTDVLVDIEGGGDPAFRQFVWVQIEEEEAENWCIGGVNATEMGSAK